MENARTRILVVRPDHLGDVLLTLPGVAALRRAIPGAWVTLGIPPSLSAVGQHCPWVDETIPIPFPPLRIHPREAGWIEAVPREADRLRGRFDVAILPRLSDPWSGPLVAAAGITRRIGYAHPETLPFLTIALPLRPEHHVAAEALEPCLAAISSLGGRRPDDNMLRWGEEHWSIGPEDEAEARAALAELGIGHEARVVVLHPGSGWVLKNWPALRWGVLARRLRQELGLTPLIVGGPGEASLVREAASGDGPLALSTTLTLGGLAGLHRDATCVVATDSGPLHLAALVGTPVVGLYGPADPSRFAPLAPPDRFRSVTVELECRPCGTMIDPPCGASAEPACMTGIGVEAVLCAIEELPRLSVPGEEPQGRPPRATPG